MSLTCPSTIWISILVAIGSFAVSSLSIYLGYKLFLAGATGEFQLSVAKGGASASLLSVAPGLGFAAFGMAIAVFAIYKLVGSS